MSSHLEIRVTKSRCPDPILTAQNVFTIRNNLIIDDRIGRLISFTDEWLTWARDEGYTVEFRDVETTRTPWRDTP